jgi:hypothetical protein
MTDEQVKAAVEALKGRGEPISGPRINRYLRSVPPYIGMSYRDLLPLLKNQPLPTPAEEAEQDLEAMANACDAARRDGARYAERQKLIADSEALWIRCAAVRNRGSARGEDLTALVDAFERLRHAMSALICATGRKT